MLNVKLGPSAIWSKRRSENALFQRMGDGLPPRKTLAPVVHRHGIWTYEAPAPSDFFSREAFLRDMLRYYMGVNAERPDGERW